MVPLALSMALMGSLVALSAGLGLFIFMTRKASVPAFAAVALGSSVALVRDLLGEAALPESPLLDLNSFFLALLFALGALTVLLIERAGIRARLQGAEVAAAMAVALAIHTMAEAMEVGGVASSPSISDLVQAVGGLYPELSFALHKFVEAMIVGISFSAFASRRPWRAPFLAFLALITLSGILGVALPYGISLTSSGFFAFAAGASLYYIVRMGEASLGLARYEAWKVALLALAGFLLYYGVGAVHSLGAVEAEAL